jgi:hypothetical protein
MLSRPTTDQIILDCRQELLNTIDPAVDSQQVKVAIQMMENVLRNCAERAAHEIAWMHEEAEVMLSYALIVSESAASSADLVAALAAHDSGHTTSLHLADVTANYDLAGECLSAALEAVMAAGADELHHAGRAILEDRLAHEQQIMGEWGFVGRG